jgi:hypothetical protein
MRISKKVVLATTLVALSGFSAAGGAQAAFSDCPSNRVCLWGNNDFVYLIAVKAPYEGLRSLSGDANNQMDSWGNRTGRNAAGYDYSNGTGDCQTFSAGSRDNNVNYWNSDEVSSFRTDRGC